VEVYNKVKNRFGNVKKLPHPSNRNRQWNKCPDVDRGKYLIKMINKLI
jgi:hypothetical protein